MVFRRDEIVVLLGAGASVEAGIPDSHQMVSQVEDRVKSGEGPWRSYRDLYFLLRSSVYYGDGLDGTFGDDVSYNIERLVGVLDELRKREGHILYPFVGAWTPKLREVAGTRFERVDEFRNEIVKLLREEWLPLPDERTASYFKGLLRFYDEYEYPLRVFSLNYDLCVERACGRDNVQRGFSETQHWDWRLFDETSEDPKPLLLYKLHGSTDWRRKGDGRVMCVDDSSAIDHDKVALIFGTAYKMQYTDPFLFLAYELRRWTLDVSRLIITVGYGFQDDHINGILEQALRQNPARRVLAVVEADAVENERRDHIGRLLKARETQVVVWPLGARHFLTKRLTMDALAELFPEEDDLFDTSEELRSHVYSQSEES